MEYRLKQALRDDCLEMEDSAGQTVYFDKAGFGTQIRDSLRLEFQKELRDVVKAEEAIRHENLIKYIALEKYEGEIYWVRKDSPSQVISPLIPDNLESSCRVLLILLEIIQTYHSQGISLKGLSLGQIKQDQNGDFRLQDPLVINYLSDSLGPDYRVDIPLEVIRGQAWNESSDVFSWGQLAYRLLAGEDPFSAVSPEDRVEKIMRAKILDLRDFQPKLAPRLSRSIMDCLNPSPQKRPAIQGLIELFTEMINGGSYQVSGQEAENYAQKALNNRKKYQWGETYRIWFKKYQIPVFVALITVLIIGLIFSTRHRSVLTTKTFPRTVVDYYYQGVRNLDSTLINDTLYRVSKKASMDHMVVNLYISNRTRQYMTHTAQNTINITFPEFKITPLTQNKLFQRFRAEYRLRIDTIDRVTYIQRSEELTLRLVNKVWRITEIQVIKKKQWEEKVKSSPPSQTPGIKVP
jgi:hypothetical protein